MSLSDKIKEHGRVGREWFRLDVKDVKESMQKILDKRKKYLPTNNWVVNVEDIIEELGEKLIDTLVKKSEMSKEELNRRRMFAMNGGNPYDPILSDPKRKKGESKE